jgi:hypothetical protein
MSSDPLGDFTAIDLAVARATLGLPPARPFAGIFLAKFDPPTVHHHATIAAALAAGVLEIIAPVASDVLPNALHTPVTDRQNMLVDHYLGCEDADAAARIARLAREDASAHASPAADDDPHFSVHADVINELGVDAARVAMFLPHSVSGVAGLGWVGAITRLLRRSGYQPMPVVLACDFAEPKKRRRLARMMPGCDAWMVLDPAAGTVPTWSVEDGRAICRVWAAEPPSSRRVRKVLRHTPELFADRKLFFAANVPLAPRVAEYIYKYKVYHKRIVAGNLTTAFRNVFGTGLGKALGRVNRPDPESKKRAKARLVKMGVQV